jgi:hypothetical protein
MARTVPVAPIVAVRLPRARGAVWNGLTVFAVDLRIKMNVAAAATTSKMMSSVRYFLKN